MTKCGLFDRKPLLVEYKSSIMSTKIFRMIYVMLGCLALMLILDSCSKNQDLVTPALVGGKNIDNANVGTFSEPIDGCPPGYVWNNQIGQCVVPCYRVSYDQVDAYKRNRSVTRDAQKGGAIYDEIKRSAASTSNYTYINNYSTKVWAYARQIENAIINGSKAYETYASSANLQYNGTTYLSYLNNHLNPLKTTITNDVNLNSNEKNILYQAFQAINDNFGYASNLVANNSDCFPDSGIQISTQNFSNIAGQDNYKDEKDKGAIVAAGFLSRLK